MTPLLLIATLLGSWIVSLVYKHDTPAWFCIGIGAVWGLAYGLLIIRLIGGQV